MPPVETPASSSRGVPFWLVALALALLVLRLAAGWKETSHPPRAVELVQWRPVASAEAEARASGLPLLYDFSAEWCGPCQRMQREVFADRRSAQTLNALFVPVHLVDTQRETGRNEPAVQALQERYRVGAFPTLVVAPLDGGEPTIIVGYPGKPALMQQLAAAGVKARLSKIPGH